MEKEEIEKLLSKFPFVMWDRFIDFPESIQVYGWMKRKDSYKDFLLLTIWKDNGEIFYTTSSEKNCNKIKKILKMEDGYTLRCQRVEDIYKIKNSIKQPKEE